VIWTPKQGLQLERCSDARGGAASQCRSSFSLAVVAADVFKSNHDIVFSRSRECDRCVKHVTIKFSGFRTVGASRWEPYGNFAMSRHW
jgi:hypothetical protein